MVILWQAHHTLFLILILFLFFDGIIIVVNSNSFEIYFDMNFNSYDRKINYNNLNKTSIILNETF